MAGAIDLHTPHRRRQGQPRAACCCRRITAQRRRSPHTALTRAGSGHALPSTLATGYRYAEMGYTACFEPAMLPANARQAHMEMGDTPIARQRRLRDARQRRLPVAAPCCRRSSDFERDQATTSPGRCTPRRRSRVKVVNPGGISAFKFNQRKLDVDEKHVHYGVTPREMILTLARGAARAGRAAPAAHPRQQPRRARQRRDHARRPSRALGRPAAAPDAHPVPQLRHRGRPRSSRPARAQHRRGRQRRPEHLDRRRPDHVRPDRHRLGRHHAPVRNSAKLADPKQVGRSWTSSATPAAASCRSATATRATSTRCSGPSGWRSFLLVRRSLARLPDHRPPQRRAVHQLPAPDPAADGPQLPRRARCSSIHPDARQVLDAADRSRASTRCTRSRS